MADLQDVSWRRKVVGDMFMKNYDIEIFMKEIRERRKQWWDLFIAESHEKQYHSTGSVLISEELIYVPRKMSREQIDYVKQYQKEMKYRI